MNINKKIIFSILIIFVLCLSASAVSAADDGAKIADSQNDDATIANSQDEIATIADSQVDDAVEASEARNIEVETGDNDVGDLSSPAENEILSDDKIDTSTVEVKVVNGTKSTNGEVLLDFSEICDDLYDTPIYSDETYLTINGETINGAPTDWYHWDFGAWYIFDMPELEAGDYPFTIHYGGNDYFTANDFSGTYSVTKIPLHVGVYPNSVKEGNNGTIEVLIYDDVYRDDSEPWLSYGITDATLIVNNKEYKFNVQAQNYIDEGTFITIDSLPAGNYYVSFKFAGDENYMAVEEFVSENQFSVISKDNKANINNIYTSATDAYKGHNLTIDYEIYGKVDGIEMNGNLKIILVDENEIEYEYLADVDEDGEGSIDLGWNLTSGTYILKVQYMGNDYYNPSELITVVDWDEMPVEVKIYDENNKKIIDGIYLNYCYTILKGENTTFNISIDKYSQISDMPFTGTLKIILRNVNDESDTVEYLVTLDKSGKGSIDLGYNLTGTSYNVDFEYSNDPVYSYENEYSYYNNLEIYSEENKASMSLYDIYIYITSAFKNHNGTVTLDFTYAKKGNIPIDGTVTIQLKEANEEESFEYVLDIIDDIATVDLGYNFTYNEYGIYISKLNLNYYYTDEDNRYMSEFLIYDEEHKAPAYYIDSDINSAFKGYNTTLTVDLSRSKIPYMPLTGKLKISVEYDSENEYEYMLDVNENGIGSIDLGYNLTSGEYIISGIYLGNEYYESAEYDYIAVFDIYDENNKACLGDFINYSFDNITKGENATITLDLSPYQVSGISMAGTMNITLINRDSGEKYYYLNDYVVDDSGKCIAKLGDNLPLGKYYFFLSYSGNDLYNGDEFTLEKKVYFDDEDIGWDSELVYIYVVESTVVPKEATSLTASNVNINANPNSGYFKVTLKSNGAALAGQNVTITFNGKSYTALTDKNGVASFKLSSGVAKKYPVAISFKGNDKYLASSANAYVTIKKNSVKFSSPTKKVKKAKAKKAKFKITLKTSNKKVLAKKLVYIKINKKTYKAKTNAKGVATFKLKLAKKKKTYKYTVTFKGDKANAKKTYKGKLAVK